MEENKVQNESGIFLGGDNFFLNFFRLERDVDLDLRVV